VTSKERFLTALKNGIPDRVPLVDWLFSKRLFKEVLGINPDSLEGDFSVRCARKIGHDATWIPYGGYAGTSDKAGIYVDEWGTTYKKDLSASWPIDAPIDYPIKTPSDLKKYKLPDPTNKDRLKEHKKALAEAKGELALFGGVPGPFTTAWLMLGYPGICYWIYDHPKELQEIFRISNDFYSEAIRRMVDVGMDAIMIAEDLGFRSGLFLSPDHYRKHLFPYLGELIHFVKKLNVPVIFHCDGNINEIISDIISLGINALNPIERKASMDIVEIKEKYGKKICLIGNLDIVNILPNGSPQDVKNHVKNLIKTVGKNGGYIVASEHSLNHQIPLANIQAIRDAVIQYGYYST